MKRSSTERDEVVGAIVLATALISVTLAVLVSPWLIPAVIGLGLVVTTLV